MAGSSADEYRSIARVYQLVSEFIAPILLGFLVDWQAGTLPWGLVVGTFAGLGFGGLGVMRLIREMDAADKRAKGPK